MADKSMKVISARAAITATATWAGLEPKKDERKSTTSITLRRGGDHSVQVSRCALLYERAGNLASAGVCGKKAGVPMHGSVARGPLARPGRHQLPQNRRLPAV